MSQRVRQTLAWLLHPTSLLEARAVSVLDEPDGAVFNPKWRALFFTSLDNCGLNDLDHTVRTAYGSSISTDSQHVAKSGEGMNIEESRGKRQRLCQQMACQDWLNSDVGAHGAEPN